MATLDYDALARDFVNTPRAPAGPGERTLSATRYGAGAPVPPAPPAAPPATAMGRMGAELPTAKRLVRGADGILRAMGSFGAKMAGPLAGVTAAIGEGVGVANTVNDPRTTGLDVATRVAEGTGRLAAMGAGAGLGAVAAGPLGATVGGALGYFAPNAFYAARDWWQGRGATQAPAAPSTAAPMAPSTAAPMAPVSGSQAQIRAVENAISGDGVTPANAPWTTATAENIRGRGIPADGTGGFINNRTGAVTTLDSRDGGATTGFGANPAAYAPTQYRQPTAYSPPAAAPPGWTAPETRTGVVTAEPQYGPGSVASGVGATLRMRQSMADDARGAADRKLAVDSIGRGATAAAAMAKADQDRFQTRAARAHYERTGNAAEAAAVAAGRPLPIDKYTFTPTMDQNKLDVGNTRSGVVERVAVQARPTENDIRADMKKVNPATKKAYTREELLQEYRNRGIQTGGFGATR